MYIRNPLALLSLSLLLACGSSEGETGHAPSATTTANEPTTTTTVDEPDPSGDDQADSEDPVPTDDEEQPTAASPQIPEALLTALREITNEPVGVPDEFYYRSNELRHDVLTSHLQDIGGVTMGVGSDQLYTLAAMAGSSLIIGVDYDPRIRIVHAIYNALVPGAPTPDALIERFSPEARDASLALIEQSLAADSATARHATRIFTSRGDEMHEYLQRVQRRVYEGRPGSWLGSQAFYEHIHRLFSEQRVLAFAADLTGSPAIQQIGRALQAADLTVGILYMSNAEQFFPITAGEFRNNIRALPFADTSLVVRTVRHARLETPPSGRWHYMLHAADDMTRVISDGETIHTRELVNRIARDTSFRITPGISRMPAPTPNAS